MGADFPGGFQPGDRVSYPGNHATHELLTVGHEPESHSGCVEQLSHASVGGRLPAGADEVAAEILGSWVDLNQEAGRARLGVLQDEGRAKQLVMLRHLDLEGRRDRRTFQKHLVVIFEGLVQDEPHPPLLRGRVASMLLQGFLPVAVGLPQETHMLRFVGLKAGTEGVHQHR